MSEEQKIIPTNQVPKVKQEKMEVSLTRVNGVFYMEFSIPEKIENIFKNKKHTIEESKSWPGLKFYSIPSLITDANYKSFLSDFELFDNFGSPLWDSEKRKFNVAFLRTVGGQGKLQLDYSIPVSEITLGFKRILAFVQKYHNDFVADTKVSAQIIFEL